MLSITPIPAFDDNYIWMLQAQNQVVIVDPGAAAPVQQILDDQKLELAAILITHHHHDHTGGVQALCAERDIPVYGPNNCKFSGISRPLADGDNFQLLGLSFDVKAVPGHTLDHICYFFEQEQQPAIFCGDSLFLAGCGRVFEGSMSQMLAAMNYFKGLPATTKIYCTHEYSMSNLAFASSVEPNNLEIQKHTQKCRALRDNSQPTLPSVIATELLINPFLRFDQSSVKAGITNYNNAAPVTDLETFTELRAWKDNF